MDTKTYEYMKERCSKFRSITLRIENLKKLVNQLEELGEKQLAIVVDTRYTYAEGNDKERFRFAMLNTAFDQIKILEQILSEI